MDSLTQLATARPFRILVFPGYLQNANVMSVKLEQLRQSLAHCCEFIVVDPPFVVHPPTPLGGEPPAEEYNWAEASDAARVWWFLSAADREKSWVVPRLDETMWYLRSIMETKGPFDAIFAFSQGAACASLLIANLDDPSRHPAFAKPAENWPPAQFKFAVLISGFLPIDPRIDWFDKKPIDLPTLHVLAAGDSVVSTGNLTPIEKVKEPTSLISSSASSVTIPSPITPSSPKPELVDAATDTHDLYCPVQLLTPPTPTKASRPRPMSAYGPFRVASIDLHLPEEQPSAAPLSKKISSGKLRTLVAFFNRGSEHQKKEKSGKRQT
ncbi:hypothetical protein RQP46_007952 [Phenoliferia psychrophenolica]